MRREQDGRVRVRVPEPLVAPYISSRWKSVVHIPIHDERALASEEVDDVLTDELSATELDTEAFAAQGRPEECLGVGGVVAHEASAIEEELLAGG